jgi:transcriptional regulator with XRE-family HTH domain
MADPTWLAARLRELRESAGLTQPLLAGKVGCRPETVSRWERGLNQPSWAQVLALCQALRVGCAAFAEEPDGDAARRPGRPRKRR